MGLESDWQEIVETSYAVVDQQIDPFFFDKVAENLGIKRDYRVNHFLFHFVGLTNFPISLISLEINISYYEVKIHNLSYLDLATSKRISTKQAHI